MSATRTIASDELRLQIATLLRFIEADATFIDKAASLWLAVQGSGDELETALDRELDAAGCSPAERPGLAATVRGLYLPGREDSAEYRLLWDAIRLCEVEALLAGVETEEAQGRLNWMMRTEAGYRLAMQHCAPQYYQRPSPPWERRR